MNADKWKVNFRITDWYESNQFRSCQFPVYFIQILCWLGVLYCPLIPLVTCFKLVIAFYIKRALVLKRIFEPTQKLYRADRSVNERTREFMNYRWQLRNRLDMTCNHGILINRTLNVISIIAGFRSIEALKSIWPLESSLNFLQNLINRDFLTQFV